MSEPRSGPFAAVAILIIAGALALGNILFFALAVQQLGGGDQSLMASLSATYERNPAFIVYLLAAHAFAGVLIAVVFAVFRGGGESKAAAPVEQPRTDSPVPALRMLALLQQEGRFIDFVQEDIDTYSDAQVGAAARAIHTGCRKVLREHMQIERIFSQDEGSQIELAAGFDATAVRLSGNVHGKPPFRGTLEHSGWRTREVKLPAMPPEIDANVLAPAEVEVA